MVRITFGVEQVVTYRNWQGEVRKRRILPLCLEKKITKWHGPDPQWCLEVLDLDLLALGKDCRRSLLLAEILEDHPM